MNLYKRIVLLSDSNTKLHLELVETRNTLAFTEQVRDSHFERLEDTREALGNAGEEIAALQADILGRSSAIENLSEIVQSQGARLSNQSETIGRFHAAMKSNASGNVVLVRSDGFSKPYVAFNPVAHYIEVPSAEPRYMRPEDSMDAHGGYYTFAPRIRFASTGTTDGFGRAVFKEVA